MHVGKPVRALLAILLSVSISLPGGFAFAQQRPDGERKISYRYFLGVGVGGEEGSGTVTVVHGGTEANRLNYLPGDRLLSVNGLAGFRTTSELTKCIATEAAKTNGVLLILHQRGDKQFYSFAYLGTISDASGEFELGTYQPARLSEPDRYLSQITVARRYTETVQESTDKINDVAIRDAAKQKNVRFWKQLLSEIDVNTFPREFQRRHAGLVECAAVAAEDQVAPEKFDDAFPFLLTWGLELHDRTEDMKKLVTYLNANGMQADLANGPRLSGKLDKNLRIPAEYCRKPDKDQAAMEGNAAAAGLLVIGGLLFASWALAGDGENAGGAAGEQGKVADAPPRETKTIFHCSRCGWSDSFRPFRCPSCSEGTFFWTSQE